VRTFEIKARDLPDAWFQAVDLCYQQGRDYLINEGSYAGQTRRELDYVTIHITHPHVQPMLPEIPPQYGLPDPVPTGWEYVTDYLPYLMTPEKKPGEQYTYGSRLFGDHFRDALPEELAESGQPETGQRRVQGQVLEVIEKFKRGFGNNQATMTIAQPSDIDLPDPPCLRQIDCRIYSSDVKDERAEHRDDTEQLHFCVYFRSWDLWAGFPPNLAAIACLQQDMAQQIGVEPGEIIAASKGLHLYDHFWELARVRLGE